MPQTDREQRDNSGALFQEENPKSESSPPYTGPAMIDGVEYRVAMWPKQSKSGKKFLSLAFTKKSDLKRGGAARPQARPQSYAQDDIPF